MPADDTTDPQDDSAGGAGAAVGGRGVAHLDVDCFFAQAEVLRRPELDGKPVAVAGGGPRSVVATASYEARRYGVHSAMPLAVARRRCPALVVAPPDLGWYRELSWEVCAAAAGWGGALERVGLDEVYLQVDADDWDRVATAMRASVLARCGLRASVGVAPTRTAAKLASEAAKPDGQLVVAPGELHGFLSGHRLAELPGVGPVAAQKLGRAGLEGVAEAVAAGRDVLVGVLGEAWGDQLWRTVTEGGATDVVPRRDQLSVGCEQTFDEDVTDAAVLDEAVDDLARRALGRLARSGMGASNVTVKVRSANFEEYTRTRRLGPAGLHHRQVHTTARELARELWARSGHRIRLAGVTLGGLSEEVQLQLFAGTVELADPVLRPQERVTHPLFGDGEVVAADDRSAVVRFGDRVRVIDDPRRHLRRSATE